MPFYQAADGTQYHYKKKDEIGRGIAYFKAKGITPPTARPTVRAELDWSSCYQNGHVNRSLVCKMFRTLSLTHHPDKGGSPETYKQIVSTRDRLLAR